ncbi:MAG: PTS transporter subunit EIIC [Candidatus Promineifilaceae bacterium]
MRERLQQIGGFLAGMVIPNIGAFIAWGLITALFIPTGWIPSDQFSALVGPMILNLLPILIGYTGGKMIHGHRGGVLGAVATMGVVVAGGFYRDADVAKIVDGVAVIVNEPSFNQIPMFLGGMIMGPIAGWIMQKVDEALEDSIPVGFEMLVNNFSAGILGTILAMLGVVVVGPFVVGVSGVAEGVVNGLINTGLLPLAAIVIEPAKVLFLNNALNHGVLGPLGVIASEESGRAIHFLLETNPGPGLGLLVAYYVAGKGMLKDSAPGAMIIHFLGGIHEIYFPYVLAHPIMILSVIAGGLAADLWFVIFGAGLVATPSPGSIFAYFAVIPPGQYFQVLGGVLVGAVAAAFVGMTILRVNPVAISEGAEDMDDALDGVPGLG